MEELWKVPNGNHCAANQVLYHLGSRGIEYELMPWMNSHNVPVMAYCPIAQGGMLRNGLLENSAVKKVALAHGATPVQVLLSFAMHSGKVIAIPKASSLEHMRENAEANLVELTQEDMQILSENFQPPRHRLPLDIV